MAYTYLLAGVLLQGPIADRPAASVGRYWYLATDSDGGTLYHSDGVATWTQAGAGVTAWGTAATAKFSGSGSPVGVVKPDGEGDLYVDTTTPALWQASGATSADWQNINAGGGIAFATANSGTYLDITTTGDDGIQGILLHDTGSTGGINIQSDSQGISFLATTFVDMQGGIGNWSVVSRR